MRNIIYNDKKIKLDFGVFFGKGVFETIHYTSTPLFYSEHIERLKEGLKKLNMAPLEEEKDLENFINNLSIGDRALKITVTDLNIIVTDRELTYKESHYEEGFSLHISKVMRNSTSLLTYIKSTCYIENLIEKEKAIKRGYNDVLFLNERGNVTETSCGNIFIIKDNRIFTPPIEDGLLNGIIRRWTIDNFNVVEKNLFMEDINDADEIFITNSLMGIMKINSVDKFKIKEDKFYRKIKIRYEKHKQNMEV